MSKKALVEKVAEKAGLSVVGADKLVDAVFSSIKEVMQETDSLPLRNFGSFNKTHRKEREGINPSTGEKITIQAKEVVRFKASKNFLD